MPYSHYSKILLVLTAICLTNFSTRGISQEWQTPSARAPQFLKYSTLSNDSLVIPFVQVGDPGNEPDTNGFGSVENTFLLGQYDITAEQYCVFLNSVATTADPHSLYDEKMSNDKEVASIQRTSFEKDGVLHFSYQVIKDDIKPRELFPITYISWNGAARFCNWLENGEPTGNEDDTTTEKGTYDMSEIVNKIAVDKSINDSIPLTKIEAKPGSHYRLPTFNQIYKATFYKGGGLHAGYWKYPTASNKQPENYIGAQPNQMNYRWRGRYSVDGPPYLSPLGSYIETKGPYGSYDMGGDVKQWTETLSPKLNFCTGEDHTYNHDTINDNKNAYYCQSVYIFGQSWFSKIGGFINTLGEDEDYTRDFEDKGREIFNKDESETLFLDTKVSTVGFRIVYIPDSSSEE